MLIEFEESEHIYSVNGDIASISVTELLHKHGLAPDYSGVNPDILKASAEKGKTIHKDLELILNEQGYEPKTEQGKEFAKWVEENIDCGVGEQMLAYNKDGTIFVGTADFMGFMKDGSLVMGDHKTTSKFQREYISWQVSLLDYFARQLKGEKVNGHTIHWSGAKKFYCFHYYADTLKVIELDKIPDEEIERLLDCEIKGETYQRQVLAIDSELEKMFVAAENEYSALKKAMEIAKAKSDTLRAEICKLFEQQGIKSWENELLKVTYTQASDKILIDSKKLKEKYPQIYTDCQKLSKTKATIRVTNRAESDSDLEF